MICKVQGSMQGSIACTNQQQNGEQGQEPAYQRVEQLSYMQVVGWKPVLTKFLFN